MTADPSILTGETLISPRSPQDEPVAELVPATRESFDNVTAIKPDVTLEIAGSQTVAEPSPSTLDYLHEAYRQRHRLAVMNRVLDTLTELHETHEVQELKAIVRQDIIRPMVAAERSAGLEPTDTARFFS